MNYQFENEWDENTDIEWRREGRRKLNTVIRMFNDWQIEGKQYADIPRLRARIEWGIQTFGQEDGGSNWLETLNRMKQYVESIVSINHNLSVG